MSAVPATAATAAPRKRSRRPRARLAISLLLLALLAAGGAYAAITLTRDAPPVLPAAGKPALLTAATLEAVTAATGHAVYGVVAPAGTRPEITRGGNGEVWVRYLSGDAKLGDARADYLTIGTYPRADALAAAKAAAEGDQQRSTELADGGVMLWSIERPESVYAASPGSDLLVEVYSPDPEAARELVTGGAVAPLR
jgi:hypothetical protein